MGGTPGWWRSPRLVLPPVGSCRGPGDHPRCPDCPAICARIVRGISGVSVMGHGVVTSALGRYGQAAAGAGQVQERVVQVGRRNGDFLGCNVPLLERPMIWVSAARRSVDRDAEFPPFSDRRAHPCRAGLQQPGRGGNQVRGPRHLTSRIRSPQAQLVSSSGVPPAMDHGPQPHHA